MASCSLASSIPTSASKSISIFAIRRSGESLPAGPGAGRIGQAESTKDSQPKYFFSIPTTTFKGTIEHVDPRIDPKTRAFTAYVTIHNPALKLKPGLTGFMHVRLKTALAVPTVAVINPFGENASVFAIDSRYAVQSRRCTSAWKPVE
jgi:multidrug efflux pump subunit AcrA (membrane-fusion protein)